MKDYRKAFGGALHLWRRIVIMNDSDDTGEKSVSYVKSIEVSRSSR